MDDIKKKIVITASHQFEKNGCKRITMDDIAHELGISKRTLYEHFSNKEELLRACLDRMDKSIEDAHRKVEKMTVSPLEVAILLGRMHEHYSSKYHLMASDLKKYYPELVRCKHHMSSSTGETLIEKWLRTAADNGYLRDDVDCRLCAETIVSISEHLHTVRLTEGYTKPQVMHAFLLTYVRGLLNINALEDFEKNRDEFEKKLSKMKFE